MILRADLFCRLTVQAVTSDGTTAWSAPISPNANSTVSDFQGGLVVGTTQSIMKLDGITGQAFPAYAVPSTSSLSPAVVHTDGTIFTVKTDYDSSGYPLANSLIGVDPTTGAQKFSVQMDNSTRNMGTSFNFCPFGPISGDSISDPDGEYAFPPQVLTTFPIVAGDGYAYVAYYYQVDTCTPGIVDHLVAHLMLLRVGSDGSSSKIDVQDWESTAFSGGVTGMGLVDVQFVNMITNADTGVLLTWRFFCGGFYNCNVEPQFNQGFATIAGGKVTSLTLVAPSQDTPSVPVLQAQDGSFFGQSDIGLAKFDQFGNVKWNVPNDYPYIATADGGVIGTSGITYDANGNATGQLPSLPNQSWTGNGYQLLGTGVALVLTNPIAPATPPAWSFLSGNQSFNLTSPFCHDSRDQLIAEYGNYAVLDSSYRMPWPRFTPNCFELTNSAHSVYFQFSEINTSCPSQGGSPEFGWALIKNPLTVPASSGYGLDAWRQDYNAPRIINSGYRDPKQNNDCGGVSASRHILGDAADLRNQSGTQDEWDALRLAALQAHADFREDETGPCGLGCVHADWRYHDRGKYTH